MEISSEEFQDLCENLNGELKLLMKKYFEKNLTPQTIGGVLISTGSDFLFYAHQNSDEDILFRCIATYVAKGKEMAEQLREEINKNG